jgi:hypothetical protein
LRAGLPHSEISGSKSAGDSPELFAACHVLLRLSTPRHPPNALLMLDLYAYGKRSMRRSRRAESLPRAPPTRAALHEDQKHRNAAIGRAGAPRVAPSRSRTRSSIACTPLHHVKNQKPERRGAVAGARRPLHKNRIPSSSQPHPAPTASRAANRAGGAERVRTDDLLLAKQALSQLSYSPAPEPSPEQRSPEQSRPEQRSPEPPRSRLQPGAARGHKPRGHKPRGQKPRGQKRGGPG